MIFLIIDCEDCRIVFTQIGEAFKLSKMLLAKKLPLSQCPQGNQKETVTC